MKTIVSHISISKNRGFTLIEALIGFLILSIGMLGIASLQALSLKAGKTSAYESVAIMKVEELFESMRANLSTNSAVLSTYSAGGVDNGCIASSCNGLQLAAEDVFWWEKNLKYGLPSAATSNVVVTPAVSPSKMAIVSVTINWSERSKSTLGAANKSYTATTYICHTEPC